MLLKVLDEEDNGNHDEIGSTKLNIKKLVDS